MTAAPPRRASSPERRTSATASMADARLGVARCRPQNPAETETCAGYAVSTTGPKERRARTTGHRAQGRRRRSRTWGESSRLWTLGEAGTARRWVARRAVFRSLASRRRAPPLASPALRARERLGKAVYRGDRPPR